ncbi:pentatricopeptide repeat-containing-like protein isoform X1 [Cinnamomum micranthum f. kanehirae]|uniref:Pentatricopeptide repeat-containing-like protein isoform X1 n=1 Tax=Cinnamomum micranthum f. kanehirae TaxID=337451 RepID=A0A3S3Q7X6_9MAGN|nr:pentatricopeptide repeat-containing-like protein isoform X1 [Cinnamomum micranthum f. kanehirae]
MHWFSKKPIQPFFGGKNLPSPPPPFSSSSSSSSSSSFLRFLKPLSSLPFSPPPFLPSSPSISSLHLEPTSSKFIASSFKEWLSSRDPAIFNVLSSHHGDEGAAALSRLHLRLSESFVLQVLAHLRSRADVLTCLRFFDWAGRQRHFHHTRATFHAIFKILSRARLMTVMLDWLHAFSGHHRIRFHDTLVMGYAVAGQPDIALFLLGKMRFQGLDLNPFAYHVLFNALVEQSCFDAAEVISKQISMRGLDSEITSCIRMKNLCKQGRIDDAQAFLRQLGSSGAIINKRIIGVLVNALCKKKRFNDACTLLEEFGQSRKVPTAPTYSLWISNLIDAGKVDQALNFFHSKKKTEGFVPETLSYNKLICGLLRDNRLAEVYRLLAEMWEAQIAPDKVTMNAALCFFCKAGMVGYWVTPNGFSYYHLIKALCGDGSIDEACQVFEDSLKQGYFPGKTAFQFLADSLCRDGRLDEMSKLMDAALQKNIKPISSLCVKYISALCKAGKAEEGYLVPCKFNRPRTTVLKSNDYVSLIDGLIKLNRGDAASRLLLEMHESGYPPSHKLYRSVICYLCRTANLQQVLNILDMHLPHEQDGGAKNRHIFNYFIDGAGQALKPELAREVFERMSLRGIQPNMDTNILMLCSYLKSECIGDALNFFNDLANKHEPSNQLYNIMIVGLCKAGKPDHALEMWSEVRERGMVPTLHCYKELVNVLCTGGDYDKAIKVLNDFQKTGRNVSSFIGNMILSHTLEKPELNRAWVQSSALDGEELMLGQLVGTFSGGIRVREHLDSLEEVVEQFFQIDIFTCNILLRELTMEGRMDYACDLFHRICKKGYRPNRWTYDIIVHGFCKHGRRKEAERWMEAMYRNGFYPTFSTVGKYNYMKIKGE